MKSPPAAPSSRWNIVARVPFRTPWVSSLSPASRCWKWSQLGWCCCWLMWLTGCAGYHVGPVNGLGAREKSVQINPFVNKTLEPRLTDAVTHELRREVQRDGTYEL